MGYIPMTVEQDKIGNLTEKQLENFKDIDVKAEIMSLEDLADFVQTTYLTDAFRSEKFFSKFCWRPSQPSKISRFGQLPRSPDPKSGLALFFIHALPPWRSHSCPLVHTPKSHVGLIGLQRNKAAQV